MKPNHVNVEKCIFCGLCTTQCTHDVFQMNKKQKTISITNEECIECGHCIAICPSGALSVEEKLPPLCEKYPNNEKFLLMLRSRRSMRRYKDQEVSKEEINELAEFGRFAPTGSNREGNEFLFVKEKENRKKVTDELMKFYIRLYKIVSFFLIKWILLIFLPTKKALYYLDSLRKMIERYKNNRDPLFFHAPVIAFVYSRKFASSTPKDDACYALYNIVLGAESMGLSTCINQLAVIAFNRRKRKIRKILGLSKKDKIYACTTIGYPNFDYKRTVFRKPSKIKII